MGVSKLLVLCIVILVAYSEGLPKQYEHSVTVINSRHKRETEIDLRPRDKPKPINRKPIRPFVPTNKRLPITLYPTNAIERRNLVPLVGYKTKTLNNMKSKNDNGSNYIKRNLTDVHVSENYLNFSKDTDSDSIEAKSIMQNINSSVIEKRQNHEDIQTSEKTSEDLTKIKFESEVIDNDDQISESQEIAPDFVNTAGMKALSLHSKDNNIEQNPTATITPKTQKILEILLPTNAFQSKKEKSFVQTDKPKITSKDNQENKEYSISDNFIDPLNNIKTTKNKVLSDSFPSLIVPSTILHDTTKMVTPTIKAALQPQATNESVSEINSLPRFENQNKMQFSSDVKLDPTKTESDEEIVIENHNFEELYENVVSDNTISSFVTRESHSGQNLNIDQPTCYENYDTPQTYNKVSYYNKYPDEYLNSMNIKENRKQNNEDVDVSYFSHDDNVRKNFSNIVDTDNINPWYESYSVSNPYQQQYFKQRSNIDSYNLVQGYPNRIWRSWKNNLIFIRPKCGSTANTDLYKSLGRYLANVNTQNTPVYNPGSHISSTVRVHANQNTLPYSNSFQPMRYGY